MKVIKSLCLFLMVGSAVWGKSYRPDDAVVQLLAAENSLKNMATALEMYAVDHGGQYPENLDALRVVYLKLIPTPPGEKPGIIPWGRTEKRFCCVRKPKPFAHSGSRRAGLDTIATVAFS